MYFLFYFLILIFYLFFQKDKKAKDEEIKKYKESFFEMLDDAVN